jgi:hypothetical protein
MWADNGAPYIKLIHMGLKLATNQRKSKKGTKNLRDLFVTISKPDVSLEDCAKFQRAVKKEE